MFNHSKFTRLFICVMLLIPLAISSTTFNQGSVHAKSEQNSLETSVISEVEKIIPTPQEVQYSESFLEIYTSNQFTAAIMLGEDSPPEDLAGAEFLQNGIERLVGHKIPILTVGDDISSYTTIISIGSVESNSFNKEMVSSHNLSIPENREGYIIHNVKENIKGKTENLNSKEDLGAQGKAFKNIVIVAGNQNIGSYYGSTSLAQMLKKSGEKVLLRGVTVRDWPDMEMRAIKDINNIEGFFSFDDGMDWMKFLPSTKMNMFSLCYTHLTESGWRNPSADYLNAVNEMANYSRDTGLIQFQHELNPGYTGGLPENDEEVTQLINLFKVSLDAGGESIMLAFDDQGSTDPSSHSELANTIYNTLQEDYDFTMVTVPEPYHFGYGNIISYLKEYTENLNPNIDVVWTGNELWSHFTTPEHVETWMSYTDPSYTKPPFYWHNDPVLDLTRSFTGWQQDLYYFEDHRVPFHGVDLTSGQYIWEEMQEYTSSGVIENIFRSTTAHQIYAIELADWMWNPDAYENNENTFLRAKRYYDTLIANPAHLKKATASSEFRYPYGPERAVDGITSRDNVENAWATASGVSTIDSWWKVDLGLVREMKGVRVKYREFEGKAYMVPKSVTVQVSDDNQNWRTVIEKSDHVPNEGDIYKSNPYSYEFQTNARYIRLLFEDGGFNSLIELSEFEVIE
ncbi:F5/8 type C domain-containing protein [Bacillus oleivorans]|uniref:F5/8 type C domain-containing protein n=1 Tax=Bacillus oleivorans TaxID=1448271 RepID=A0A285CQY0_9BACI|nr:beta-N-acetylglucosaminidase domain-containing protein [Bacillus oleivorans]SNX69478.1 F5/8 type C domain-containing protein [Bacillus oleivorans]